MEEIKLIQNKWGQAKPLNGSAMIYAYTGYLLAMQALPEGQLIKLAAMFLEWNEMPEPKWGMFSDDELKRHRKGV